MSLARTTAIWLPAYSQRSWWEPAQALCYAAQAAGRAGPWVQGSNALSCPQIEAQSAAAAALQASMQRLAKDVGGSALGDPSSPADEMMALSASLETTYTQLQVGLVRLRRVVPNGWEPF